VVHLRHHGDGTVLEAFDHPHLPQRPGAVEGNARDVAAQLGQFVAAAGGGECDAMAVPVDVEVGVLDPHGVVEVELRVLQLAPERGNRFGARAELRLELGERVATRNRRHVENDDSADVEELRRRFEVEEGRVETAESLHGPILEHVLEVGPSNRGTVRSARCPTLRDAAPCRSRSGARRHAGQPID